MEDVEFGKDEDLAADVDDGEAEEDPEALDTEDEDGEADLDIDEASDSEFGIKDERLLAHYSSHAHSPSLLASSE